MDWDSVPVPPIDPPKLPVGLASAKAYPPSCRSHLDGGDAPKIPVSQVPFHPRPSFLSFHG